MLKKLQSKASQPKFKSGQTFRYRDSILMIVDVRKSEMMGFEYMVLLEGEVHGWLTQSVLDELSPV